MIMPRRRLGIVRRPNKAVLGRRPVSPVVSDEGKGRKKNLRLWVSLFGRLTIPTHHLCVIVVDSVAAEPELRMCVSLFGRLGNQETDASPSKANVLKIAVDTSFLLLLRKMVDNGSNMDNGPRFWP
jgi:hypothetical protein